MHRLWNYISDVYARMDDASRSEIEGLWRGMERISLGMYADLYGLLSSLSLEKIVVEKRVYNQRQDITQSLGTGIRSIPVLQDYLTNPFNTYTEGVDYALVDGMIDFGEDTPQKRNLLNGSDEPTDVLFAPYVVVENPDIWHWALIVDLNRAAVSAWDLYRVLDAIKVLANCYVNGATVDNVRGALAVLLDIPYAKAAGEITSSVFDTDEATVVINDGTTDHTHIFACSAGEFDDIISGTVTRYTPLISTSIVINSQSPVDDRGIEIYPIEIDLGLEEFDTPSANNFQEDDVVEIRNLSSGVSEFVHVAAVDGATVSLDSTISVSFQSGDWLVARRARLREDQIVNCNFIEIDITRSPLNALNVPAQEFLDRIRNPRTSITVTFN